jgi:hypothetical protein
MQAVLVNHGVREMSFLTSAHFESDLARTIYNDAGRSSRLPERVQRLLERRLIAFVEQGSTAAVIAWGSRLDAALVPRLSPAAFRRFCAVVVARHPHAIETMPHTLQSVKALMRAVHVSRHINAPVLQRLLSALQAEGLVGQ